MPCAPLSRSAWIDYFRHLQPSRRARLAPKNSVRLVGLGFVEDVHGKKRIVGSRWIHRGSDGIEVQVYHVEVSGVKSDIAVIVYPVLQANGEDKQRRKDRPESEPNCFPPVCKLEKVAGNMAESQSTILSDGAEAVLFLPAMFCDGERKLPWILPQGSVYQHDVLYGSSDCNNNLGSRFLKHVVIPHRRPFEICADQTRMD
ncbi:uncharacterized protein UDID_18541 [Ustilago sp. UG-2017a]|nr:uncharacterized protein UDID_18541 [Ustilago sp. UG-2017a]